MVIEVGDELLRLVLVAAVLTQRPAPGRQIVPARAARGLRVGRDHLDVLFDQIAPVVDALGIALAHQEHDGRGVGRAVVRQTRLPVLRQPAAALGELIDVVGERKRHHVRLEAVDHRTRLLAGAAVRLLDGHILAGLLLPVLGEGLVERLIELPRGVVRDVQERGVRYGSARRKGAKRQRGCREQEQSASSFQPSHWTLQRCFPVGAVSQIYHYVYQFDGHSAVRHCIPVRAVPGRGKRVPSGRTPGRARELAARRARDWRRREPVRVMKGRWCRAGGMTVSPGGPRAPGGDGQSIRRKERMALADASTAAAGPGRPARAVTEGAGKPSGSWAGSPRARGTTTSRRGALAVGHAAQAALVKFRGPHQQTVRLITRA